MDLTIAVGITQLHQQQKLMVFVTERHQPNCIMYGGEKHYSSFSLLRDKYLSQQDGSGHII